MVNLNITQYYAIICLALANLTITQYKAIIISTLDAMLFILHMFVALVIQVMQ